MNRQRYPDEKPACAGAFLIERNVGDGQSVQLLATFTHWGEWYVDNMNVTKQVLAWWSS
jgi:hypothetical protein